MIRLSRIALKISSAAAVFLAVVAATQAPAFSQNLGLEAVFSAQSFDGLGKGAIDFSPLSHTAISAPVAKSVIRIAPVVQEDPLVPNDRWSQLNPLTQKEKDLVSAHLPLFNASYARRLPFAEADKLFSQAVSKRYTLLQIFTNYSWKLGPAYFIEGSDVEKLMGKYATYCLIPAVGNATDGKPYHISAIVIGRWYINIILDRDNFQYHNPSFPDHDFIANSLVTWRIMGPGDLSVSGLRVAYRIGPIVVNPAIEEITQLSPYQARVHTNHGDSTATITPVTLNAGFSGRVSAASSGQKNLNFSDAFSFELP